MLSISKPTSKFISSCNVLCFFMPVTTRLVDITFRLTFFFFFLDFFRGSASTTVSKLFPFSRAILIPLSLKFSRKKLSVCAWSVQLEITSFRYCSRSEQTGAKSEKHFKNQDADLILPVVRKSLLAKIHS